MVDPEHTRRGVHLRRLREHEDQDQHHHAHPDSATNRYQTYGYNEIGAVTSDGSYTFTYDALGQPLSKEYNNDSSTLEYYVYTPSDERIGVQRGAWWWWSVRDESGKVLRQYKSSATDPTVAALWLEDFVWRDGLLLGSQRPPEMGVRRHFHLDHLGTPRLITSDAGQMVSYHDYYPFGDERSPVTQEGPSAGGFDREEPMKFTGQERDYAGGMGGEDPHAIDDMHARDYSPMVGRFFSVDPVLGNLLRPQSWNRYAYVSNNPLNFDDPLGLEPNTGSHGHAPGNVDCPPEEKGVTCFETGAPDPGEVPQLPVPRTLTWYEGNLAEFARARAKPLLEKRIMPHRYGRTPDYYTFTLGVTSQYFVGGGGIVTLDRSGNLYGGLMGLIGTPGKGTAIVAGWIMSKEPPAPRTLSDFISGYSSSFSLSGGLQAGFTWGGPGLGFAEEYGLGIAGLGGSPSYSWGPIATGLSWPEQ